MQRLHRQALSGDSVMKIAEFKNLPAVESVYRLKGKRFRYKVVFDYKGQGVLVTEVYRRPRTWYWKKLKS